MKNKVNKLLAVLVALIMSCTLFASQGVFATETDGKTFNANQIYQLNKTIPTTLPQTVEAWIKLPKTVSGRGGVILGNYNSSSVTSFNIEIFESGAPRFYYSKPNVGTGDVKFTNVDVRSNSWIHLAFTWANDILTCYVNGENKGSQTLKIPTNYTMNTPLCIGGDTRSGNTQYFKGAIKQVAVYKDVRTQAEIKADMEALDATDSEMLMAFNIASNKNIFEDLSSNGYLASPKWLTAEDIYIPEDYDFSFMAIGDTQIITENEPAKLKNIYDYVIDNVESKKVKHVFGLGDITDNDIDSEWDTAKAQIARMDGVVPYSIVRGNHDIYSSGKNMKKISKYDQIYGPTDSAYAKQYTYCFEGEGADFRARNTIHFFSSDTRDYMVVALDYGASDNVLNWASEIIKQHPYHNVIVTTHAYLATNGTTLDASENCPPTRDYNLNNSYGVNNGDHMWDKFVSKHENIVLVMCGHDPKEDIVITQTEGDNGNIVTQLLIDPQAMDVGDAKGMVATFYVAENGEDITVEWYSTIKNAYFKKSNNYSFKVNVIERESPKTVSFEANGGSGEMESIETGAFKYTLPECTFTSPSRKHVFKGWSLAPDGETIDTEAVKIEGDTTFYAIWEEIELPKYKVSVSGGTVTPLADVYEQWSVVTVKADEPKEGKRFTGWYGLNGITILEGNSSSMEITFEMPNQAVTISAMYEDILFNIKATAGANGKISKSGNILVKQGKDYTFTFTPNDGYKVKDVLVNGVSVGAVESYTFTGVKEDATISVEFEEVVVEQEPSDTPNDKPSDAPSGDKNESSSGCGSSADMGATTLLVTLSLALLMVLKRIKG